MRAILNNKLYDTEKADFLIALSIPQNNFGGDVDELNIYKTKSGNIFVENVTQDCLVGENKLKTILSRQDCVDIYINIFGEVEEA